MSYVLLVPDDENTYTRVMSGVVRELERRLVAAGQHYEADPSRVLNEAQTRMAAYRLEQCRRVDFPVCFGTQDVAEGRLAAAHGVGVLECAERLHSGLDETLDSVQLHVHDARIVFQRKHGVYRVFMAELREVHLYT